MLRNLTITNFALIEHLDLDFGPGLTIITGETGAGKSIMLGALSLVMGSRADTRVISDGGSKAVVEATFTDVDPELKEIFTEKEIDWFASSEGVSEMTIRREITASGRSKVFVNDSPVTLQTLSAIVPRLIDIHSQHANVKINDPGERLKIIDAMASNERLRVDYKALFDEFVELRRRIKIRKEYLEKTAESQEFIRFQLEQLDRLKPEKGELAEVEQRFELLSDADEVKEKLMLLCAMLGDGDRGVQSALGEAAAVAGKIDFKSVATAQADEQVTEERSIEARIRQLMIGAKDICETVEDVNSSIDTDPATLAKLSARMNLYYETMKHFKVKEADELAELHADLKRKMSEITSGDDEIPEMEREARRLGHELKEKADRLSETRRKTAEEFSELIRRTAQPLGLPNIAFEARLTERKLASTGKDEVEFLCSFNKNASLRPISEIASGGEIARMMLSLKSILAGHINLPTIIFDEVDTGVSGEIADKMGRMMHDVSEKMQVVVITHLPQVAAQGDAHLKVYKTDADTRTVTHVRRLGETERVRELAAMISGSEVSEAALSAARALLDSKSQI